MFILDGAVHETWKPFFEAQRHELERIGNFLERESANGKVQFPHREFVLRAFEMSVEDVRVLILGQDPYPTPGHAIGYAFATLPNVRPLPASLRNIFKEVATDIGSITQVDATLKSWRNQGVLLLNRVLTVEERAPGAHRKQGWEEFSQSAIEFLISQNHHFVALLWGKDAQSLADLFDPARVLLASHPSPLSAYRGFIGSHTFSKCNELLKQNGFAPVDWR
jgi:uracil-DNA glycosylase